MKKMIPQELENRLIDFAMAGLEGDFGEFLGGVEFVAGGAVVVAGAGNAGLEETASGAATVHGDLAVAAGGGGFLVLDEFELGADEGDERGGVAVGGGADGGVSLEGELAKDKVARVGEAAELAFFPAVGGVVGEAGGIGLRLLSNAAADGESRIGHSG